MLMPIDSAMGWNSQIYRKRRCSTTNIKRYSRSSYRGEFNREVREEHLLRAFPLLCGSGDLSRLELPLAEIWNGVDDDPGNAASKVYNLAERDSECHGHTIVSQERPHLMQQEAHKSRRDNWVPNPHIPSNPLLLKPAQGREVCPGVQRIVQNEGCGVESHDTKG